MRFTLGRVVHFYYVAVMVAMISLFAYGVKYYWESGLLNIDYVSNLYDGTSKVKAVKERNDLDELKKFVDGDRIKDANKIFSRMENDVKDLKAIKSTETVPGLEENMRQVKQSLIAFQSNPELAILLSNLTSKVAQFENFVTEKQWPTLTKMSVNLRNKISPGRLMVGGLYNFDRTQNLIMSINNDLEAMTNFTESSGLPADIKGAIINRIKVLKDESAHLSTYVEDHKKFNRLYKDYSVQFISWFKQVEPEIAFKKIQFEKSSQTIFYSIIFVFTSLIGATVLGFVLYNYSTKKGSQKTEKLIMDTIKDGLLPVESKMSTEHSAEFNTEFSKYRDYAHKRMAFGSIFQEAMPFASILLDSNLNVIWGNTHFFEQWQMQNFQEEDDSLTWDFLQRFTDLEDNSAVLSALRMSAPGTYKIQVKSNTMAQAAPFEMFVSPVDYSGQKRILVIFYPMKEAEEQLSASKAAMTAPILKMIELQSEEKLTTEMKMQLRTQADKAGSSELFSKLNQYIEKTESIRDDLNREIERLEVQSNDLRNTAADIRKTLVSSFETQRASIDRYHQFKASVTTMLETRDQLEDQFRFAINSSREIIKDQTKILNAADKAEKNVDDYIKSLKTITTLKGEFKELKSSVEEFKSRIVQVLDQLLIFQSHENDTQRVDQFLGKIKIEIKGFEKVLQNFNDVVTQLDVTVTKVDMMVEGRERADLDSVRYKMEAIKNNLENVQFSVSKLTQVSHSKDEEMIGVLKGLVANLKSEMKRINELCKLTGMGPEQLEVISQETA